MFIVFGTNLGCFVGFCFLKAKKKRRNTEWSTAGQQKYQVWLVIGEVRTETV
jgi:hypothetical protein